MLISPDPRFLSYIEVLYNLSIVVIDIFLMLEVSHDFPIVRDLLSYLTQIMTSKRCELELELIHLII